MVEIDKNKQVEFHYLKVFEWKKEWREDQQKISSEMLSQSAGLRNKSVFSDFNYAFKKYKRF
jgi:hypothetical protein